MLVHQGYVVHWQKTSMLSNCTGIINSVFSTKSLYSGGEDNAINKSIRWLLRMTEQQRGFFKLTCWNHAIPQIACQLDKCASHSALSDWKSCKLHFRGLTTPHPVCDRNCSSAEGERNVSRRGVVCLSVSLHVCWSSGLPFYGVLVRPTQIWFHSPWQSQAPLLTAGFIWCGCPVLGFSAGFNIWSPLWPEEERMLVDDSGQTRREVGGVEGWGWREANRWRVA